jgi:hypothetical protein
MGQKTEEDLHAGLGDAYLLYPFLPAPVGPLVLGLLLRLLPPADLCCAHAHCRRGRSITTLVYPKGE